MSAAGTNHRDAGEVSADTVFRFALVVVFIIFLLIIFGVI